MGCWMLVMVSACSVVSAYVTAAVASDCTLLLVPTWVQLAQYAEEAK